MTDAYLSERDCYSRKIKPGDVMLSNWRLALAERMRLRIMLGHDVMYSKIRYEYIEDHWTHLPERAEMKSADIMMNEANGTNRQLCHVYVSDVLCIIIKTNCHIFWDRSQHYCSCCGWKLLGTS